MQTVMRGALLYMQKFIKVELLFLLLRVDRFNFIICSKNNGNNNKLQKMCGILCVKLAISVLLWGNFYCRQTY